MTEEERLRRKGARELVDVEIDEISIVDNGANRKKFYIVKREGTMDLKKALEEFLEGFDVEKALSEDAIAAITKSLEILSRYKSDFPDDVLSACQILAAAIGKDVDTEGGNGGKPKLTPQGYGYSREKDGESRPVSMGKSAGDRWPSIAGRASATSQGFATGLVLRPALQKSEGAEEDGEDDDPAPFLVQRRAMKKSIDSQVDDDNIAGAADDGPVDLWPSLSRA
jgi:hypothetical protein